MKPDLRDVTVCTIDSANVALSARALRLSMARCDFADAMFISSQPVEGPFRTTRIDKMKSLAAYQVFLIKELPALIETPYVLIVQWDGYVIDAGAWQPSFRDYDYIGARWHSFTDGMSVGNGGFSLRSKKLLAALCDPRFTVDSAVNEDLLICRAFRPALESEFGIRFAPNAVANQFSYENIVPNQPTFGFHGMASMWRHVEDAEMIELVAGLAPYVCRTPHYIGLMVAYFLLRKSGPLLALYSKLKATVGSNDMVQLIKERAEQPDVALQCIGACEKLAALA